VRKIFLLFCLILPGLTFAQTGSIIGTVTQAHTREPIIGVTVKVYRADTVYVTGTTTDERGKFVVGNLPPARYRIEVLSLGYKSASEDADLSADSVVVDIGMIAEALNLNEVTITASRQPEKVIDAPSSVTVIDPELISSMPTLTPFDHLTGVTGVDIAQSGLVQKNIVTRGFNNIASGALSVMTDNRIAAIPSLRVNVPSFIPLVNDDIDHIDVVRGPASALYGPDAAEGIVNIITKSPFASQGLSATVYSGERSLFQGAVRYADAINQDIAFKISTQYFRGYDWQYVDSSEQAARQAAIASGAKPDTLLIGNRDPMIERVATEGRMDFNLSREMTLSATAGINDGIRSIELTEIGSAQVRDWRSMYYQLRFNDRDFFAQAYLNQSNAGNTYVLLSGNPIVDRSTQFVAQAQNVSRIGASTRLVYGADLSMTNPVTDGTINGRNENDDNIDEYGGYIQSDTHLQDSTFGIIAAARIDKHNRLADPIFSPRAAFVFKPSQDQDFRLTYNKAFSTPATNDLFLDILAQPNIFGFPTFLNNFDYNLRAEGVPTNGYNFNRDGNGRPYMYSPFQSNPPFTYAPIPVDSAATVWTTIWPLLQTEARAFGIKLPFVPPPGAAGDIRSHLAVLNPNTRGFDPVSNVTDLPPLKPTITQTFEFGYKGVIANSIQLGVDIYHSKVTDFIGSLQTITPNVFLDSADTYNYIKPLIKQALIDSGYSNAQADAMAGTMSGQVGSILSHFPVGTVSPKESTDPAALLVSSKNYGDVQLNGVDISLDVLLTDRWTLSGTYSYVDHDFFSNLDGVSNLALNAPRNKGSIGLRYDDNDNGITAELRNRWVGGFEMSSGIYMGYVNSYSLLDANASYYFQNIWGLRVLASASNVLNNLHQEFLGAPQIGRLIMVGVSKKW